MTGPADKHAPSATGAQSACVGKDQGGSRLRLILGSASPRRRELLAQIGVIPDDIRAATVNETPLKGELPHAYVDRIAQEKALAVQAAPDELVLTADTEVAVGRRILGKPLEEAQAVQFLLMLSGRRHRVATAVCLKLGARLWRRRVETRVQFKRLSDAEVSAYIRSGEWRGRAGGYAIQGLAGAFVPQIIGSYTNVVGLPLCETAALLQGAGYPLSFENAAP